jgi:uncharacterized protein
MKMKNLTLTICLTLAVLLGGTGTSWGADYDKGVAAFRSGDFATALREFRTLAEQGDTVAQFNLGEMYRLGDGVSEDHKRAAGWYTLAAEQGHATAQHRLGVLYFWGLGVIQDYVYAHMWLNIAASNGNEDGGTFRDFIAKRITPAQIEKAQDLARECVAKKYKGC